MTRFLIASFVVTFCLLSSPQKGWSQSAYKQGELIVKLKSSKGSIARQTFVGKVQSEKGLNLRKAWGKMGMYHFSVKPGQSLQAKIEELNLDPDVEYAEPNYLLQKTDAVGILEEFSPEDILAIVESEGVEALGVDESVQQAWAFQAYSNNSNGVGAMAVDSRPIVAVIDTGLDLNHQVFQNTNSIWTNSGEIAGNGIDDDGNGYIDDVNGWNFVDNSGSIYDDDDHGTHVSGIILNVDQSIHVNPATLVPAKIRIMPLKFLNGSGVGSTSDAVQAIYYAVNNGAKVLNNSWGGYSYSAALHEAVTFAYNNGVTFIAAAGNDGSNNDSRPLYPASYDVPNIIAVAATYDSFNLTSFSNYGNSSVDLGAWGYFINSTIPDGAFGSSSGTSMSAPFVAGTAIQMIVQSPNMLGYQVKQIINEQTEYHSVLDGKVYTKGRLHPTNSINYASGASVDSTQPDYSTSYAGNRELASSLAGGGGCGMVSEIVSNYKGPGSGGRPGGGGWPVGNLPGPKAWYILLVVGILLLPVAIALHLRNKAPENKRRHERFIINSGVRVQVGEKELVGSVSTISLGGVQLNTEELLENGGIVTMTIQSPTGEEQIQVNGQIVWREEKKAYGVAFQDAPLSALDRISLWTQGLKKSS